LIGLAIGFLGVVVLAAPWRDGGVSSSLLGVGASLLASASYAASYVYARRFLSVRQISPLVLSTGQMVAGAVLLGALTPGVTLQPITLTTSVVVSVVVLGVAGTGIAYVLNYRLIADEGATAASTVTYLLPIVAVLLGLAVLAEPVGWNLAVGALIVLAGVALSEGRFGRRWHTQRSQQQAGLVSGLPCGEARSGVKIGCGRPLTSLLLGLL
jgi:drug/metabolite transporter (DMT)-like permease